jgi:NAD(P)-dependent dehydrogenase (short-subunit alcohol dehydrogenase family)
MTGATDAPRTVLVTGAASGIGAALVRSLTEAGCHVLCLDRHADRLSAIVEELGATPILVDVGDYDALAAELDVALADRPLDGLVNNAGVGNLKRLEQYTPPEWELLVRVNLTGVFNCLRTCKPALDRSAVAGRRPSVVNVGSVSGVRPTFGEAPYSAAKAGVVALTMSAALEWAPHIRVNAVSPGFIETPLNEAVVADATHRSMVDAGTPLGRVGQIAEVCGVVEFLLGDASAYVTGQNLVVDGGSMLTSTQVDALLRGFLGVNSPGSGTASA